MTTVKTQSVISRLWKSMLVLGALTLIVGVVLLIACLNVAPLILLPGRKRGCV